VAFRAVYAGSDRGLYLASPAGLRKIARKGEVAPSSVGLVFTSDFGVPAIGAEGEVVFGASLSGGPQTLQGIYRLSCAGTPGCTP
jgi:hypothetical protein